MYLLVCQAIHVGKSDNQNNKYSSTIHILLRYQKLISQSNIMGKAKKLKLTSSARHAPLGDQIKTDDFAIPSSRPSKDRKRIDEEDVDKFVDGKLSEKILSQARQQVKDLEYEELNIKDDQQGKKHLKPPIKMKSESSDDDSEDDESDMNSVKLSSEGGFDGQG